MQALGNILEATRFAADQHQLQTWFDYPRINLLLDTASILWHVAEIQDQKVLIAALLHQVPAHGKVSGGDLKGVFGEEVTEFILAAKDPEKLKPARLQRLQLKSQAKRTATARQILIAAACAKLRLARQQEAGAISEGLRKELKQDKVLMDAFTVNYPKLESYYETLWTQWIEKEIP